ncbi:MAG: hypothetical protein WA056_05300 [Gallionella sp.]
MVVPLAGPVRTAVGGTLAISVTLIANEPVCPPWLSVAIAVRL